MLEFINGDCGPVPKQTSKIMRKAVAALKEKDRATLQKRGTEKGAPQLFWMCTWQSGLGSLVEVSRDYWASVHKRLSIVPLSDLSLRLFAELKDVLKEEKLAKRQEVSYWPTKKDTQDPFQWCASRLVNPEDKKLSHKTMSFIPQIPCNILHVCAIYTYPTLSLTTLLSPILCFTGGKSVIQRIQLINPGKYMVMDLGLKNSQSVSDLFKP